MLDVKFSDAGKWLAEKCEIVRANRSLPVAALGEGREATFAWDPQPLETPELPELSVSASVMNIT